MFDVFKRDVERRWAYVKARDSSPLSYDGYGDPGFLCSKRNPIVMASTVAWIAAPTSDVFPPPPVVVLTDDGAVFTLDRLTV